MLSELGHSIARTDRRTVQQRKALRENVVCLLYLILCCSKNLTLFCFLHFIMFCMLRFIMFCILHFYVFCFCISLCFTFTHLTRVNVLNSGGFTPDCQVLALKTSTSPEMRCDNVCFCETHNCFTCYRPDGIWCQKTKDALDWDLFCPVPPDEATTKAVSHQWIVTKSRQT